MAIKKQSKISIHRLIYLRSLFKEKIIGVWVSIPWTVWGVFSFIRDEWWQPSDTSKWRFINMIPHLSLAWWTVGLLFIAIIALFEISFRRANKLNIQIEELEQEMEKLTNEYASSLQVGYINSERATVQKTNKKTNKTKPHKYIRFLIQFRNICSKTIRLTIVDLRIDNKQCFNQKAPSAVIAGNDEAICSSNYIDITTKNSDLYQLILKIEYGHPDKLIRYTKKIMDLKLHPYDLDVNIISKKDTDKPIA